MERRAERPGGRTFDAVEILDQVMAPLGREMPRSGKELAALPLEDGWNPQIAKRLYELRKQSVLSQQHVTKRAGVSIFTVSRLEDADLRRVSWVQLLPIARALASLPGSEAPLPVAVRMRGTRRVLRVPQRIGEAKRVLVLPLRKRRSLPQ